MYHKELVEQILKDWKGKRKILREHRSNSIEGSYHFKGWGSKRLDLLKPRSLENLPVAGTQASEEGSGSWYLWGGDVDRHRTQKTKELVVSSPPGFQSPSSVPFWKNRTGSPLLKQKYREHHKAKYRQEGLEQTNNSLIISKVPLRLSQWQLALCDLTRLMPWTGSKLLHNPYVCSCCLIPWDMRCAKATVHARASVSPIRHPNEVLDESPSDPDAIISERLSLPLTTSNRVPIGVQLARNTTPQSYPERAAFKGYPWFLEVSVLKCRAWGKPLRVATLPENASPRVKAKVKQARK